MLINNIKSFRYNPSTIPTIFFKEKPVVLMLVNKVASSTIQRTIQSKYKKQIRVSQQIDLRDNEIISELYDSSEIYTWVRNPWGRLVSCYLQRVYSESKKHKYSPYLSLQKYNIYRNMPWEKFVQIVVNTPDEESDPHFMSQTYRLSDSKNKFLPGYIFHMENFNTSWKKFRKRTGLHKLISKPHKEKTTKNKKLLFGNGWYVYDEIRESVKERYARDFELLDYDADELWV